MKFAKLIWLPLGRKISATSAIGTPIFSGNLRPKPFTSTFCGTRLRPIPTTLNTFSKPISKITQKENPSPPFLAIFSAVGFSMSTAIHGGFKRKWPFLNSDNCRFDRIALKLFVTKLIPAFSRFFPLFLPPEMRWWICKMCLEDSLLIVFVNSPLGWIRCAWSCLFRCRILLSRLILLRSSLLNEPWPSLRSSGKSSGCLI